jgi:hypothetical protein
MSEYQYYEFRAVDRPLGERQMDALRKLSSRAEITPTSLTNTYNYGDFRGDPAALVEKYFDAFVYVANWGTRRLMFRVPRRFFDDKEASAYVADEALSFRARGDHVVVEFSSDDEWSDSWEHGEPWMPALLPLREDLLRGDFRCLYLGWLASLRHREPDDGLGGEDELEPPVPPGLARLSAPLKELGAFLRVDDELVKAAAAGQTAGGGKVPADPSRDALARWVGKLPAAEKGELLLRFLTEDDPLLRRELLHRFREEASKKPAGTRAPAAERRTVRQLLSARAALDEKARRKEAARVAKEPARRSEQ